MMFVRLKDNNTNMSRSSPTVFKLLVLESVQRDDVNKASCVMRCGQKKKISILSPPYKVFLKLKSHEGNQKGRGFGTLSGW